MIFPENNQQMTIKLVKLSSDKHLVIKYQVLTHTILGALSTTLLQIFYPIN